MHIGAMAQKYPDRPAVLYGDEVVTYAQVDARSSRLAQLFRAWGLEAGDSIAVLIGNEPRFYEFYWAAMRAGLFFTPINTHLAPGEMQQIADDCDAKVLVVADSLRDAAARFVDRLPRVSHRVILGGSLPGFEPYPHVADAMLRIPISDERAGVAMLYSSGTTGKPKGVRRVLPDLHPADLPPSTLALAAVVGLRPDDRYLNVGPLYHAAPLTFSTLAQRIGATVVLMPRFEAESALYHIERYRVTASQWVPTHFLRLLQLPRETRSGYDLTTHRLAIHAAAPCPIDVKRRMIEWWGDILLEYYAGTEGGGTKASAAEWLAHPGTVGKHWAGGKVWILNDDGNELPVGGHGLVYFENRDPFTRFTYHKDPGKTAASYRGDLFTLGDIGYLDAEGYLYLTDRHSYTIISGGVNIYPAEVEGCLAAHPDVADAAVIGVPDPEMGEQVKAIVQPREGRSPSAEMARELIEFCRARIAHFKCPRSVDFIDQMPRSAAGKLLKRELRARYWSE